MSATTVTLFSKRSFDFSNVGGSSSIVIPIVKAIDVSQYTEGTILVRVHSVSIGAGATIDINANITSPTPEEPGTDFTITSTPAGTVQLTSSTSAPSLVAGSLSSNFGGMLAIEVEGTQPATVRTISASLSAELVLKN